MPGAAGRDNRLKASRVGLYPKGHGPAWSSRGSYYRFPTPRLHLRASPNAFKSIQTVSWRPRNAPASPWRYPEGPRCENPSILCREMRCSTLPPAPQALISKVGHSHGLRPLPPTPKEFYQFSFPCMGLPPFNGVNAFWVGRT